MTSHANDVGNLVLSVHGLRPMAKDIYFRVKKFIDEQIHPLEEDLHSHYSNPKTRWVTHTKIEELKRKARAEGLWNLFIPIELDPECKYGAGLTNVEYAFICEQMGASAFSSEVFNCSAPDTGNMEVLLRYGSTEQKEKWLKPLLNGEIRSCFGMTEPEVASSDATNIQSSIVRQGNYYYINGCKWWSSGVYNRSCKVIIFMGKTNPTASNHKQQSMVIVPVDTPGVKLIRPLSVFGYEEGPGGHGEVEYNDVKVPVSNLILGEGRGFEIAQGRLGPGRIHHCMRCIGVAEKALQLMIDRVQNRVVFGKPIAAYSSIQQDIAKSRIDIEQCRLLVLKAAQMMDTVGNKVAAPEIAMIKVAVPNMALKVIDRAIQAYGGAGVSGDVPLAEMYARLRTLRIADGPDEVHMRSIARMEFRKYGPSKL